MTRYRAALLLALALAPTARAGEDAPKEPAMPAPFEQVARYIDGEGSEVGGRYVHRGTGFVTQVLRIESVPQVFLHIGSPPVSDRGEPHTQEHLLLGKGAKGKATALAQGMSLVESTAFTEQTYTAYSLNCVAGPETFFRILEQSLDALLFPDYTDEEIEREVWHLGVARDPKTGALRLVDRGTVFNEMLVSYEKRWCVFYEVDKRRYGVGHELSFSSGGEPNAIRTMTPGHIHTFHRETHHLSPNMRLIASLPPEIPTAVYLERLAGIIERLRKTPGHDERPRAVRPIPPIRPSDDRSILFVPYPNQNEEDAGEAVLAWEPVAPGSLELHLLRDLFLSALAGGETSHLHRVLLDRSSRRLEVHARSIWGGLSSTEVTEGAMIGLSGYAPEGANEEALRAIERAIREEVDRVAAYAPGDEGLSRFNRRVETRLLELERDLKVRLGTPPLFGRRGGGAFWHDHLELVDRAGGDERSLTLTPAIERARARLAERKNPWPEIIDGLGLRNAPIIGVSVASAEEVSRRAAEQKAHVEEGRARLMQEADGLSEAEVLARVEAEQEEAVAAIEARDRALPQPHLAPDVPLTLDDRLVSAAGELAGVPVFRAHFEAMSAAEVALAFRVEGLEEKELALLPLVPSLLVGAGLRAKDGETIAYDALQDIVQRELLALDAWYDLAPDKGRRELFLRGSGADLEETKAALSWLGRAIHEVDLSEENLPRLLDLVDQLKRGLRGRLGGSDEGWVNDPAAALRFETDAVYLSAGSIHARIYHLTRMKWRLTEWPFGTGSLAKGVAETQKQLAAAKGQTEVDAVIAALRKSAPTLRLEDVPEGEEGELYMLGLERANVVHPPVQLLDDLKELAGDLPPATLGPDLAQVLGQLADDLARPPAETLADLRALLAHLYAPSRARLVLTGKPATLEALAPDIEALMKSLPPAGGRERHPATGLTSRAPVVRARVAAREGEDGLPPVHFGLVHETSASGVFLHSAKAAPITDLSRDALLSELASSIYGGAGPHAFFMNTWAAGLAYSNGLRVSPTDERVSYYAERCPDLVQTMRFVVDLAKAERAKEESALLEYAVQNLVRRSRASDRFADRARAQAADLAEGVTPKRVAAYRRALLALLGDEEAWETMRQAAPLRTGRVLVGLGAKSREQEGGVFLTIGPERLLSSWEDYVREEEGDAERVHRIWPGDFWVR